MTRLALGVLLWSVVHFIPALAVDFKKNVVNRIGEQPYKGVFALLMVFSLYLIISGWKSIGIEVPDGTEVIFTSPSWGKPAAALLVLIGYILFLAPYQPSNIKRLMRHPQLAGMLCWGVGHVLALGTARAMVLFGGLAGWAIIETVLLNHRDGNWLKPDRVAFKKDVAIVLFGILAYMVVGFSHHFLFGVSPFS